ncbi:hypothetical protein V8G54_027146 [Vigna mungo]|uniref:Uncharacterized protein n=1 Tax=Vigna mungo TaxID=3915 RepID=A0AAQ3N1N6_VIGMU
MATLFGKLREHELEPGRYKKEKGFLHRWLDKEEKIIAYTIGHVLLLGRPNNLIKLTSKDVYRLNAIMFRIPTNLVAVFKWHVIDVGVNDWCKLPYGVFISKILSLNGVNLTGENKITCNKANQIGKATLTCIGLKRIALRWIFSDEKDLTKGQDELPDSNSEQKLSSPMSEFERFVANRSEKVSKRASLMKKSLKI